MLEDQKHDTHLFVEVNQAIKIWPIDRLKPKFGNMIKLITTYTSEVQKCSSSVDY